MDALTSQWYGTHTFARRRRPEPVIRTLSSSRGGKRGHVVLFSLPNPRFPSGTVFVHDTALIPGEFPCDFTHLCAPGSERASFALYRPPPFAAWLRCYR